MSSTVTYYIRKSPDSPALVTEMKEEDHATLMRVLGDLYWFTEDAHEVSVTITRHGKLRDRQPSQDNQPAP